jgi:nitroreductase
MQFSEVVQKRRSVGVFATAPVEPRKLETILETARLAPPAGDLQAYQIAVIDQSEVKTALAAEASGQHFLLEAPRVLVFCASPEQSESKYRRRGASLFFIRPVAIMPIGYAAEAPDRPQRRKLDELVCHGVW